MSTRPIYRRAAVLTLSAAALTAALAAPALATSQPSPRLTLPGPCTNGVLVNWLNTSGNGYAGGIGYELQFTNISAHACTLHGFPGVSAVNLVGHRVGVPASRSGSTHPIVTVPAGHTVRAAMTITNTGNFPSTTCKPVTAAGLRVYAPNQTSSDVIPFPFSVCSSRTVSLGIQSVI